MAFRRAWKTRNIDGLVYGEVPQLDLPVEYDSSRSDDDDDVDDDDTDNDEPQPRPRPRRRNSFPVDPRLDELAAEAIDAALAALPRRPCGAILYVVRPSQRGDEATLHDLRHIVPLNLGRGEPEAGLATYPPPGEDRPERHAQKPTWPMEKALPFDVYSIIMGHLSRDDIENLRSTCKEIEFQVSHTMFESAVVPFNPEIYGMLRGGHDGSANLPRFLKGYSPTLYMGHGLEVFKGFGPYIKKFGMSFEIDEGECFEFVVNMLTASRRPLLGSPQERHRKDQILLGRVQMAESRVSALRRSVGPGKCRRPDVGDAGRLPLPPGRGAAGTVDHQWPRLVARP
jgi:hypothetical protein